MAYYSDPKRASDPYALPDVEVFEVHAGWPWDECPLCTLAYLILPRPPRRASLGSSGDQPDHATHKAEHLGWYWQSCFPGCLPDSDPIGPFATEAEALADAQEGGL